MLVLLSVFFVRIELIVAACPVAARRIQTILRVVAIEDARAFDVSLKDVCIDAQGVAGEDDEVCVLPVSSEPMRACKSRMRAPAIVIA